MSQKKYNLITIVVFIILLEGLAKRINIVAHPEFQPVLTAVIAILTAIVSGLVYGILPEFVALYSPEGRTRIKI